MPTLSHYILYTIFNSFIHKEQLTYTQKNAAVLKGIAAFFCSTNLYKIAFISANSHGLSHSNSLIFRQVLVFLFNPTSDKHCYKTGWLQLKNKKKSCLLFRTLLHVICLGCRSPPIRFDYSQFRNRNGGKQVKNFNDNDYALNKCSENIVYRFADSIVEITPTDYLAVNPDKTLSDFKRLKEESDTIYYEQDREGYSQTYKNTVLNEFMGKETPCVSSPEEILVEKIDARKKSTARLQQLALAEAILDKLTEIQRRRYLLHVVNGLTTREIAEKEGVAQRTVMDSLEWAEKKIKKFFSKL